MGKGKSGGGGKSGGVSSARLHQSSGKSNSFGGYTKVSHGGGSFSMQPTGKK